MPALAHPDYPKFLNAVSKCGPWHFEKKKSGRKFIRNDACFCPLDAVENEFGERVYHNPKCLYRETTELTISEEAPSMLMEVMNHSSRSSIHPKWIFGASDFFWDYH